MAGLRFAQACALARSFQFTLRLMNMLRRTAWIWAVGAIAWTIDAAVALRLHSTAHAELAILMALLFFIAWLFYRNQR